MSASPVGIDDLSVYVPQLCFPIEDLAAARNLSYPKLSKGLGLLQMAVADARKAADMFNTKLIQVPILGVVENMAWFTPEKHPNEKYYLFGNGGGQQLADQLQAPLLVRIPLVCDACELGDTGQTIFASKDRILIGLFENLASQVSQLLATTV